MTAVLIALRAFLSSALGYLLAFLKVVKDWFLGLTAVGKIGVVLCVSVLLNIYQWRHSETVANAKKMVAAECVKEAKAEETKAVEIHEDRQSILDVLLASDKADNQNRLDELIAKLNTAQVAHATIKAAKPLPVNCVFDDERVRAANSAIADARYSAIQTH